MWAFLALAHMGQGQALWAEPNWHLHQYPHSILIQLHKSNNSQNILMTHNPIQL